MPSLILGCSCAERLISAATGHAADCRVEHGQFIVHLPRIPTHVFGLHVGVTIGLESVAVCDSGELVLRYRVHHVAGLPGWLVGGLVDWLAGHLVRHPLVRVHHGQVHVRLNRLHIGPQTLTAIAQVTDIRVPAGAAACVLTVALKE